MNVTNVNDFIIKQINDFIASNLEKINKQQLQSLIRECCLAFIEKFNNGIGSVDLGPLKKLILSILQTLTAYIKDKWL